MIKNSDKNNITQQYKVVFPKNLNPNNTLYGGEAIKWMDEVAYITATRLTHQRMVTISVENIKFLKPVYQDTIIEINGIIERSTMTKVYVKVDIYAEQKQSQKKEKVIEGRFVLAALDNNNKPGKINI